jgi:hypothetical protein
MVLACIIMQVGKTLEVLQGGVAKVVPPSCFYRQNHEHKSSACTTTPLLHKAHMLALFL